jgi:hypothetical protein
MDKGQHGVQGEGDDTAQEPVGDAHGKAPVLKVGDALLLGVGGQWVHHRQSLQSWCAFSTHAHAL